VGILDEGADEAAEAAKWYESQRPGLGAAFEHAVDAALDLLEEDLVPLTIMPRDSGQRGAKRLILKRFPYDVVVYERGRRVGRGRACSSVSASWLLARSPTQLVGRAGAPRTAGTAEHHLTLARSQPSFKLVDLVSQMGGSSCFC
jgi:toxin ParE1/3/4